MNPLIGQTLINSKTLKKYKVITTMISNSYEYIIIMNNDGDLTRIDSSNFISNYTIENFEELL